MRQNRFQIQREQLAAQGPQKWRDTLLPNVERLRRQLMQRDPREAAQLSGTTLDDERTIRLLLWDKEYTITRHATSEKIILHG